MTGLLISFEGGDGAGKGIQAGLLRLALEGKGREVVLTREPGGTPLGEKIRHLLKFDPDGREMANQTELLLFIAGRAEHFKKIIAPALAAKKIVICDRFIDSSVVYQGLGRGLGPENVHWLNAFATSGRPPDITFLLDIPEEVGYERVHKRKPEVQLTLGINGSPEPASKDRMDEFGLSTAKKIRQGYLQLATQEPERFVVVDANREPQEIAKEVLSHVKHRLAAKH